MNQKKLDKQILVSIIGKTKKEWQDKLKEINKRKIKIVALFLSAFPKKQIIGLFEALANSCIREIPLVHLREETTKNKDIKFLIKNFKTKYFTVHEVYFNNLKKWGRFHKKLFLEMDYDNYVSKNVKVEKIGGFCIDLSHFKISEEKLTKDFEYILEKQRKKKLFKCNHLNGYDPKTNKHFHKVKSLKYFEYLKNLPEFIFGNCIAIETWNTIAEQLRFKKKIISLLKDKL